MPPKRRAAAASKGRGGKRAKKATVVEDGGVGEGELGEEAVASTSNPIKDSMAKLKRGNTVKKRSKPDAYFPVSGAGVYLDYDCMLNQTNIGHNNNKFYIIQVLEAAGKYYAWNRWGRVGETGQHAIKGPTGLDAAIKDFEKKFKDKTRNKWEERGSFTPSPGKYTLIEVESTEEEDMAETAAKLAGLDGGDAVNQYAPCTLDKSTQSLVKLIFDNDMFKEAMASFEIDVKKMPLGKLSKAQIAKGFDVLVDLENAIKSSKNAQLDKLTSTFYTLIPHDFGRQRPPIIRTEEQVRQKKDMLLVLADIELAQAMQKEQPKKKKSKGKKDEEELLADPLDTQYGLLNCDLETVDKKSKEFKVIKTYLDKTKSSKLEILDVWKVARQGEEERFEEHDDLDNRKLLWHGTNVAVVAAILKSGLRIMPHSGGRVGRGIYFASENAKSAGYVRCTRNTGIMFLNEVALGREHHIIQDDWRLIAPPKGYDCIIAKGRTEPDAKFDTTLEIDGKDVVVPQGAAIPTEQTNSNFYQSEYLIYKESQNRIRYLLKLKFNNAF